MKKYYFVYIVIVIEILMVIVGLVEDFSDEKLQFLGLPKGIGVALSMIAITMVAFLFKSLQEGKERALGWDELKGDFDYLKILAQKGGYCAALHEREFYFLWKKQFNEGQNNIDITHMGSSPPRNLSNPQIAYFDDMMNMVKESKCNIRRVERLSPQKREWIEKVYNNLLNQTNFSLSLVVEKSSFMPISVSRIDDKYAWIVALSQAESTRNYRDILITDKNVISLITGYYQEKIWNNSVKLIERGKSTGNWQIIKNQLDSGVDYKDISKKFR